MSAAALIADPAGDADGEAQFQVCRELVRGTRKAVSDTTDQRRAVLLQDGEKILVRITLVQEHGLAYSGGELELAVKRGLLNRPRRKVPEVIETTFPGGYDLRLPRELFEHAERVGGQLRCMVGMDAGGREQPARARACELERFLRPLDARPGHHHLYDA